VRDRRIDRVLGHIALDAHVVAALVLAGQRSALHFHLVRGLPGARDDFVHAAHRLRIRRHHADRAEIVQHVFGGNRLAANARVGERDVFGNRRIEMMADHQHVEMLGQRVDGVGPRRVRR